MDSEPTYPSVRDPYLGSLLLYLCTASATLVHPIYPTLVVLAVPSILRAWMVAIDCGRCPLGQNAQRVSRLPVADTSADRFVRCLATKILLALFVDGVFCGQYL